MTPVLKVDGATKYFWRRASGLSRLLMSVSRSQPIKALDGVSFAIGSGEILGLIGESGSGKTTLGRCIAGLEHLSEGTISSRGTTISSLSPKEFRRVRRDIQMVFQDSYSAMNPRMNVEQFVGDPLVRLTDMQKQLRREKVATTLEEVGLERRFLASFRHQLSGGQVQRVNIARALVVDPLFVVLDEPVSALDASVRGRVLAVLDRLHEQRGLSYLYISHDLETVQGFCGRVAIIHSGRILELGTVRGIFANPVHPYTKLLLSSVLAPDPSSQRVLVDEDWSRDPRWILNKGGELTYPPLREVGDDHLVAIAQ